MSILTQLFGSRNDRNIKQYQKTVARINALEPTLQALSDDELRAKTHALRSKITAEIAEKINDDADIKTARLALDAILNNALVEAFALCREGAVRALNMRHYDVQLIGGMALNAGKVVEMRTGEGKTLVATLPVVLNALAGRGVHVVTVNDYLAKRDAEWMGKLYAFLGLSVGVVYNQQPADDKRTAYQADITYGTNNEFGFDYLRDNMAFERGQRMQRGRVFAIVDEVDSILIDEARTPLIISGPVEDNPAIYSLMNQLPPKLTRQIGEIDKDGRPSADYKAGDYVLDEKTRQAHLSETGHEKVERFLLNKGVLARDASLYAPQNIQLLQYVMAAIRAHGFYVRNRDYIIDNNEVIIIDEFTGRKMVGRRWSDGLHQAIEAKEAVKIQRENQTLASITFQNYFRLYDKLAGMTGTADTEAVEFQQIYGLSVMVIPTHQPIKRVDMADVVYATEAEKYQAIVADIKTARANGQPVLVGTASIESSEVLSNILTKANIAHEVLNAKQHEREAYVIAQAGRPGAVTIATNMAGRGTDIVLGGNMELLYPDGADGGLDDSVRAAWQADHDAVIAAGGLCVMGTERHESRRVDNQLRGRAGRQGDPGTSRFYVSLEDSLMRIFTSDRMRAMMGKLGLKDGEALEHRWITRAIANAQRKVEGRNYEMRKQILEYDNIVNEQRQLVYQQRNHVMDAESVADLIADMRVEVWQNEQETHAPFESTQGEWDVGMLASVLKLDFDLDVPLTDWKAAGKNQDEILALIENTWCERYAEKMAGVQGADTAHGNNALARLEKMVMLQILDQCWKEHLAALDHVRQGIHLRGYAQKNPVQEYKKEAFELFNGFSSHVKREVVRVLSQIKVRAEEDVPPSNARRVALNAQASTAQNAQTTKAGNASPPLEPLPPEMTKNVGRNDPCPCGSGKKYKHCHGK